MPVAVVLSTLGVSVLTYLPDLLPIVNQQPTHWVGCPWQRSAVRRLVRPTSCWQEPGQTKTTHTDRLHADRSLAKQKQHIQTDFMQRGAWLNKNNTYRQTSCRQEPGETKTTHTDRLRADRSLAKQKQHIQTDFMQTGAWPNKNNTYRQTSCRQEHGQTKQHIHTHVR